MQVKAVAQLKNEMTKNEEKIEKFEIFSKILLFLNKIVGNFAKKYNRE